MKLTTKQLKQMVKQVIKESVYDEERWEEMEAESRAVADEDLRMQSMQQMGIDDMIEEERKALHALEDVLEEADSNIPWDSLKDDYVRLFNTMQSRGVNLKWVMTRTRSTGGSADPLGGGRPYRGPSGKE